MINDKKEYDHVSYFSWTIDNLLDLARETQALLDKGETLFPGYAIGNTPDVVRKATIEALHGYKSTTEATQAMDVGGSDCGPISMEMQMDLYGTYPDVGAYLSGDPHCMINYTPSQPTKRVRIALSNSCNYTLGERDIARLGKAMVALVLGIEDKGYQVSIDIYDCTIVAKSVGISRIVVKEYEDPFDGDMVEWLLSRNGIRWGMFALADKYGAISRSPAHRNVSNLPLEKGRGQALQPSKAMRYINKVFGTYDLVLDGADSVAYVDMAIEKIKAFTLQA